MKRFCVCFGIFILLLPAISYQDDAIALQDGWFNIDPFDNTISKAPHGLAPTDDDSRLATLLRQWENSQTVSIYTPPLEYITSAITVRYVIPISQTRNLPVTGRSPPLS